MEELDADLDIKRQPGPSPWEEPMTAQDRFKKYNNMYKLVCAIADPFLQSLPARRLPGFRQISQRLVAAQLEGPEAVARLAEGLDTPAKGQQPP